MTATAPLPRTFTPTARPRELVVEHPLTAFFVLAFGISWVFDLIAFGLLQLPEAGIIVTAFGPPVAAILVTRATEGRVGVRALLRRIGLWRVGWRWYAFVLIGIPAVGIPSFAFLTDGTENLPESAAMFAPTYLLLVAIMMFLGGGQEEPGWRGFALPRMQVRFGPLNGTLLLGLLWGLWHLPLYALISDYNDAGSGFVSITTSFLGFCGYTIALSLLMTWVFNHTWPSLLPVMLVHGSMNALFGLAPETRVASWSLTLAITVVALVIAAATRGRLGYPPARPTMEPPLPAPAPRTAADAGARD